MMLKLSLLRYPRHKRVDKLRRFFQSKDGGCDFFFAIDRMEMFIDKQRVTSQRQTTLTDFFTLS